MDTPARRLGLRAVVGVVSGAAGMAVAHLVAALTTPANSPVIAVGNAVIDATPTDVKVWAIAQFGDKDKPILIGSVLAATVLFTAVIGILTRTRMRWAVGASALLVVLAGVAVMLRPMAQAGDLLPAAAALVVGPLVLVMLAGRLNKTTPEEPAAAGGPTRRAVLLGTAATVVLASSAAAAGEWIARGRTRLANIVLPRAAKPLPALPDGLESKIPGLSAFRTPTKDFYRVDTKLSVPIVDPDRWTLRIDGDVRQEIELSYDDLRDLEMVERDITLTCVSNEVGGNLVGAARWTGVPLKTVLDLAGVGSKSDQILSTDVEGFKISTPLDVALDGRESLIALGMNGEVLNRIHGFPARLVVPGIYGYVGATKWLSRLTLTTYEAESAYWTDRDWATDGPIKLSSRIDTPRPLAVLDAGEVVIAGVAWAQQSGVESVEVQIDGGQWMPAELGPDAGSRYWRQWFVRWDATPGRHQLSVRAKDVDGNVQTARRASPFPNGSSGIQSIAVMVD